MGASWVPTSPSSGCSPPCCSCSVQCPLRPDFDRESARELIHYGGFTLGRFFNYAALQGDYVVVGSTLSSSALGIYGRAYQLLATPAMLLGQVIDRVLFPMQAEIQHDRARLANQYRRAVSSSPS